MGNSTISMVIFTSKLLVITRGYRLSLMVVFTVANHHVWVRTACTSGAIVIPYTLVEVIRMCIVGETCETWRFLCLCFSNSDVCLFLPKGGAPKFALFATK
jgi:hypothetical protein